MLSKSHHIIIYLWLVSLVFILPTFLLSSVVKTPVIQIGNKTLDHEFQSVVCTIKWPENSYMQIDVIFVINGILLSFIIPTLLILFFYISILKNLNKQVLFKRRVSLCSANVAFQFRIKKLVLSIIIVYIICHTPFWVFQGFLSIYYCMFKTQTELFNYISTYIAIVFQIMISFNSALNPYFYSLFSNNFKSYIVQIFKFLICKKDELSNNRETLFFLESKRSSRRNTAYLLESNQIQCSLIQLQYL